MIIVNVTALQLIEGGKDVRDQFINKVDVLEKVKKIVFLGNTDYLTSKMVADYYEVPYETIKKVMQRNKAELESDGIKVLQEKELFDFKLLLKGQGVPLNTRRFLTIVSRRAVLRIGMLLTESKVAEKVRTYLLNIENASTNIQMNILSLRIAPSL